MIQLYPGDYQVKVHVVKNQYAAPLLVRMSAQVGSYPLEPGVEQQYNFAANEAHDFLFPISVLPSLAGQNGYIDAGLFIPTTLVLVAHTRADIQVIQPVVNIGPIIWGEPYTVTGYGGGIVFRNGTVELDIPVAAGQSWLMQPALYNPDGDTIGSISEVPFITAGGFQVVAFSGMEISQPGNIISGEVIVRPSGKAIYARAPINLP